MLHASNEYKKSIKPRYRKLINQLKININYKIFIRKIILITVIITMLETG